MESVIQMLRHMIRVYPKERDVIDAAIALLTPDEPWTIDLVGDFQMRQSCGVIVVTKLGQVVHEGRSVGAALRYIADATGAHEPRRSDCH